MYSTGAPEIAEDLSFLMVRSAEGVALASKEIPHSIHIADTTYAGQHPHLPCPHVADLLQRSALESVEPFLCNALKLQLLAANPNSCFRKRLLHCVVNLPYQYQHVQMLIELNVR